MPVYCNEVLITNFNQKATILCTARQQSWNLMFSVVSVSYSVKGGSFDHYPCCIGPYHKGIPLAQDIWTWGITVHVPQSLDPGHGP